MATAFWAPKETKSEAPHDTLLTIRLQPAPMNTLLTSTSLAVPFDDMTFKVAERVCQ